MWEAKEKHPGKDPKDCSQKEAKETFREIVKVLLLPHGEWINRNVQKLAAR